MPWVRGSRDLSSGLCLLGLAAVASVRGADLPLGTLRQIGPGLVPRVLALLVGVCGAALSVRGVWGVNQTVAPDAAVLGTASAAAARSASGWHDSVRAPLCLLGAASAFGLLVRPLGLVVAGPLAILLATLASREAKWLESLLFAFGMTFCSVVLFRYLLSLPLPVAPWLIGY
jgi:putative tricarboxylic transport membrane protein